MQFEWPWMLSLMPLPWLIGILLWLIAKRQPQGWRISHRQRRPVAPQGIALPPRISTALQMPAQQARHALRHWQHWLAALAWVLLVIAAARPAAHDEVEALPASGRAIALAIDVSGSMEREDFSFNDQQADRLSVVQRVGAEFIANRSGDRLGLILYGKEAFLASPLTFDHAAVTDLLASAGIGMAGRSTAIGDALGLAIQALRQDPANDKAIVLLSDGTNNAGSVEPEAAAALAQTLGIRIHTIAMGSVTPPTTPATPASNQSGLTLRGFQTAASADLDEATLQSIASIAGGQYFRATSTAGLANILAAIDELEQAEVEAPPLLLKQPLHHYPVAGFLVLMLLSGLLQALLPAWQQRRALSARNSGSTNVQREPENAA